MKTNHTARRFLKIRAILLGLALLGTVGIAFAGGGALAERFGQSIVRPAEGPHAPTVDLGDVMAAVVW